MSARSKSRKRALDVLYGADVRGESINATLLAEENRQLADPTRRANSWAYAKQIVDGVVAHGDEIDELIETYSQGWPIERMPAVDRAIIRIGIWELLFNPEVPDAVAIAEAVESAKSLSTDDSSGFVNGLLGRIAHTKV
ncbi:MAG: nusB [Glaciihabitans sp.]|nr:nusB [Glaciihabitans sp.]